MTGDFHIIIDLYLWKRLKNALVALLRNARCSKLWEGSQTYTLILRMTFKPSVQTYHEACFIRKNNAAVLMRSFRSV